MRGGIGILGWCLALMLAWQPAWGDVPSQPSVLYVASERHTSLALNYAYFPHFVRLGFGTPDTPWHQWFGTTELKALLYLPGYQMGQPFEISPRNLIGSRFNGKVWASGFEALRQFDADQNGIVESDELNDLYVWQDSNSSGAFEVGIQQGRPDTIAPCRQQYAGFDLRSVAVRKAGHAREGRLAQFAVFRSHTTRIHLLEFPIHGAFADRFRAYLSYTNAKDVDFEHAFSGEWQWQSKASPAHQPGRLLLAVSGDQIHGLIQYVGSYADVINLPLTGVVTDRRAEWQSVSPLGLTRSVVQLSQEYGRPVLQGRAWSARNGKLQIWQWTAYHVAQLE